MFYHAGVSWLPAGFLGVDAFFTLSGFLITTLLLNELRHRSTIGLASFWARRARRLLPALFLVVVFCSLMVWFVAAPGTYPQFQSDGFASLLYVANWHFILDGGNYFVANSAPSLLTHTWSLAIEEQFYVLWPLVLFGLWKLGRGLKTLLMLCVIGAVASTLWMAFLFHHGASINRLYYGTDTHAQCLMVGAGLAAMLALVAQRRRQGNTVPSGEVIEGLGGDPAWMATNSRATMLLSIGGLVGLVGAAFLWTRTLWTGSFLYNGGFLVMAFLSALVILSVVSHQRGFLARAISFAPLVFIGRISYGLYLWHFPVFQILDAQRVGHSGIWLVGVRFVVTFAAAILSFYFIERPIRHAVSLKGWRTPVSMAVALVVVGALVVVASAVTATPQATGAPVVSQPTGQKDPIKVMVVGDSIALTLGFPFSDVTYQKKYGVTTEDIGILGCGVVLLENAASQCVTPPDPNVPNLFALDAAAFARYQPDVVVLLSGRWETFDHIQQGKTYNIFNSFFQEEVRTGLQKMVDITRASGAKLVILTTPCVGPQAGSGIDSNNHPTGTGSNSTLPARQAIYNGLVQSVAKANPGEVTVIDFNAMVCPGGTYQSAINGEIIRQEDGIHIQLIASDFYDPLLFPKIAEVGKQARAEKLAKK